MDMHSMIIFPFVDGYGQDEIGEFKWFSTREIKNTDRIRFTKVSRLNKNMKFTRKIL